MSLTSSRFRHPKATEERDREIPGIPKHLGIFEAKKGGDNFVDLKI